MSVESEARVRNGLIAFDFDSTLVDANSDLVVIDLVDGNIPKKAKDLFDDDNWTDYMGAIFQHLHASGVKRKQIDESLASMPFVEGIPKLLEWLSDNDFEIIIISDSNSHFISHKMKTSGLDKFIRKTFTNPARYDEDGLLKIEWYHAQYYCKLSNKNLCKGKAVDRRKVSCTSVARGVLYSMVNVDVGHLITAEPRYNARAYNVNWLISVQRSHFFIQRQNLHVFYVYFVITYNI